MKKKTIFCSRLIFFCVLLQKKNIELTQSIFLADFATSAHFANSLYCISWFLYFSPVWLKICAVLVASGTKFL